MLLGQELSVGEGDIITTNRLTYFSDPDSAVLLGGVESKEDYPGQFYLIFAMRDAILLSGLMLGIPPARISEKRKLAIMETDDGDAFGEIMNQVIGSFNSVFKPGFANKSHLKLIPPKKFVAGVDELTDGEPVPDGEYVLYRAQLQMAGQEMERVDILMPLELALLFEPQVEEPAAVAAEVPEEAPDTVVSAEEIVASGIPSAEQTILFLEDNVGDRQRISEFLAAAGHKVIDGSLGADIRELFGQGDASLALIGVADTEDRELALCIKLNAMCKDGRALPIIMCAPQWTRNGVLKALKYGARDIIVKPYDSTEVLSKVSRCLKAA
jgi:CheY-like chemotaxis protein